MLIIVLQLLPREITASRRTIKRGAGVALMWINEQELTQMCVDQRAGRRNVRRARKKRAEIDSDHQADIRRLFIALDCSGRRDEIGLWERI